MAWSHRGRCRWPGRGWCWRRRLAAVATRGGPLSPPGCLVVATTRGVGDLGPIAEPWPIGLHLARRRVHGPRRPVRRRRWAGWPDAPVRWPCSCIGLDAATGHPWIWPSMPPRLIAWYPLLIAASAWSFGFLVRDRLYLVSARRPAWPAGWCIRGCGRYGQLRKVVVGLDQIAWGMLFFLLAMAISLRKAGIWPRGSPRGHDPLREGDPCPQDPPGGAGVTSRRGSMKHRAPGRAEPSRLSITGAWDRGSA